MVRLPKLSPSGFIGCLRQSWHPEILAFLALLLLIGTPSTGAESETRRNGDSRGDAGYMALEIRPLTGNPYEGQPVAVEVALVTDRNDISGVESIGTLTAGNGDFLSFQTVDNPGNTVIVEREGRRLYSIPLAVTVVAFEESGKYKLISPGYKVALPQYRVVRDPIWGSRRVRELSVADLRPVTTNLKVKALPNPPKDMDFSGSVGEFEIETRMHRATPVAGEDNTVFIILRGSGLIAELTMPQYKGAFPPDLNLKSVSESRRGFYDHGKLISELTLECTFTPGHSGEFEIGEVWFDYFDPVTGKYARAKSDPVAVSVKSSVVRRNHYDI